MPTALTVEKPEQKPVKQTKKEYKYPTDLGRVSKAEYEMLEDKFGRKSATKLVKDLVDATKDTEKWLRQTASELTGSPVPRTADKAEDQIRKWFRQFDRLSVDVDVEEEMYKGNVDRSLYDGAEFEYDGVTGINQVLLLKDGRRVVVFNYDAYGPADYVFPSSISDDEWYDKIFPVVSYFNYFNDDDYYPYSRVVEEFWENLPWGMEEGYERYIPVDDDESPLAGLLFRGRP